MSTTTTVERGAKAGMVGGALWLLLPAAMAVSLEDVESGTVSYVAVAASHWIFAVLPLALLLAGLAALRAVLSGRAGRAGTAGIAMSALGMVAMLVGNGIEVASITAGAGESAAGHFAFLIGFLVLIAGSVPLGIVVFRRAGESLARIGGLLLALALPAGIGLGFLGSVVSPGNDVGFWAAITTPTAVAWVLLGRSLTSAGSRLTTAGTERMVPTTN